MEIRLGISLIEIHQKEGGLTFPRIERKTLVLKPAVWSNENYLCGLRSSKVEEKEEDQLTRLPA